MMKTGRLWTLFLMLIATASPVFAGDAKKPDYASLKGFVNNAPQVRAGQVIGYYDAEGRYHANGD